MYRSAAMATHYVMVKYGVTFPPQPCPIGFNGQMIFNLTSCSCAENDSPPVAHHGLPKQPTGHSDRTKELLLYFPFDTSFSDVSHHKAMGMPWNAELKPGLLGQSAYFNGSSRVEVPFLQNMFNGGYVKAFSLSLWFQREGGEKGVQGLVNNGDCESAPTFDIHLVVSRNINVSNLASSINGQEVLFVDVQVRKWRLMDSLDLYIVPASY